MPVTWCRQLQRREPHDGLNQVGGGIPQRLLNQLSWGVSDTADQLQTDIDALQALIKAARAERDSAIAKCNAAIAERDDARSQMDRLVHLLRQLQPRSSAAARRSNREQFAVGAPGYRAGRGRRRGGRRGGSQARQRPSCQSPPRPLPAHPPHIDVTIAPEDTNAADACPHGFVVVSLSGFVTLHRRPASLVARCPFPARAATTTSVGSWGAFLARFFLQDAGLPR